MTYLPGYDAWKTRSPYEDRPDPKEGYVSYSLTELLELGEDLESELAGKFDAEEVVEVTLEQVTGERRHRQVVLSVLYHPNAPDHSDALYEAARDEGDY